jgi:hypothetical protein
VTKNSKVIGDDVMFDIVEVMERILLSWVEKAVENAILHDLIYQSQLLFLSDCCVNNTKLTYLIDPRYIDLMSFKDLIVYCFP